SQGGLPGPGTANDRHFFTGEDVEAEVPDRLDASVGIGIRDVAELYMATDRHLHAGRRGPDVRDGLQEFVDAFLGGRGALDHGGYGADGSHRPHQHIDINHELRDAAHRNGSPDRLYAPDHDRDQGAEP